MRALVPWLVAALLVAALLSQIPVDEIATALRRANALHFGGIVAIGVALWFLIESAAYAYLFSRMGVSVSWRDARTIRGATYLLAPIHWNVGKAAVVVALKSLRGLPLLEGTSSILLYQLMSATALALLATAGLFLLPRVGDAREASALFASLPPALPFAIATGIGALCLVMRSKRPRFAWLDRLRSHPLAKAFRHTRPKDLAVLVFLKSAYHCVFAGVFFFGLRAFGVELSFPLVLVATPIIQIVGGLPITPAGLGTQQVAMLYFFSGRFGGNGTEAAVAAFGFSLPFLIMLFRAGIGTLYLGDLRGMKTPPGGNVQGAERSTGEDTRSARSPDTRSA